jgi:hypothetical protein
MRRIARILLLLTQFLSVVLCPFIILLKGCVYLHLKYGLATWIALAGSVLLTVLVLTIYAVGLFRFVLHRPATRVARRLAAAAAVLVVGYCGYTLLFFPETNVKKSESSSEFASLHPFVRLSLGTFLLLDSDLIVSDMSRTRDEYSSMGVRATRRSLHYPQSDGYVHAVDLRTIGRGRIRNFAIESYFWLIGFNTLRHTGTADHLHISLSIADSPGVL